MGQILKTITWLHNGWLILRYNFSVFKEIEKIISFQTLVLSSKKGKMSLKKFFLHPMNADMNDLMLTND